MLYQMLIKMSLANKIIVSSTTDDITNYLYVNGEFVYSPLSVQVDPPTWEERVDVQLLYTALMTDTLVQE